MSGLLLSFLRDADWFDARRARAYRLLLALGGLFAAAGLIAFSHAGIDPTGKPLGTDFLAFWSAARLALAGTPEAAWNIARIGAYERAAMPVDPGVSSFLYPPAFLILCMPFGLLPYFAALPLWLMLTGGAYLMAIRLWLVRHKGALITVAAFPAVLTNIGHGQNGFLTAALLGGGLALLDRRPWIGGALLGALIIKPHMALALPVLLIAGAHWRSILSALISATALCAASLLMFGTRSWTAFVNGASLGRAILDQGLVPPEKMVSIFAAMRVLHEPVALAYAAQLSVALGAGALLAWVARRRSTAPGGTAALAAAATLLMSPFLLDYDLTALAIPLAWLFSEGLRRGFATWEKILLGAGYVLPLLSRTLAFSTGVPVAPFILSALMLAVARAALFEGQPRLAEARTPSAA